MATLVDESFLVPQEERPTATAQAQIPVIDLAPIQSSLWSSPFPADPVAVSRIASQIGAACRQWGFFQVVNHGVPAHLLADLRQKAGAFFELPLEEKRLVARTAANALGYADSELTRNVRDWKEVFDITVSGSMELPASFDDDNGCVETHSNQWPVFRPRGFKDACEAYAAATHNLAFKLLELVSQSLGMRPHRFHPYFADPNTSRMRLNHYKVCPCPGLVLGVGPHKDSGAVTILAQDDVGGLQVKTKGGDWLDVLPDPQAFVVNLGGLFQVWSNDIFLSVEHRVVINGERERLSIPFFFNPSASVDVAPLAELLDANQPPLYKPLNWGKFYKRRRDSNFKNLGVENLHIYHYRIN